MPNWFVVRNGTQEGPLSSEQLKKLATTGQLRPDDLVRREDATTMQMAKDIKGLFVASQPPANPQQKSIPKPPPPPGGSPATKPLPPPNGIPVPKGHEFTKMLENPAIVGLLLLCCFPVGLVLVWRHSKWSVPIKGIWTGAFVVCFLVFAVLGQIGEKQARDELAAANKLWLSGDEAGAVSKYRSLLRHNYSVLKDDEKSLLYGRVIDFDAQSGNTASAKDLLDDATRRGVIPSVSSFEARQLVADSSPQRSSQAGEKSTATDGPSSSKFSVSKGAFSGKINVEISPELLGEIEISDLSLTDGGTEMRFKLKWKRGGVPSRDPWHYSAFDKNGTKLCGGNVRIPDSIELGQTIQSKTTFDYKVKNDITKVVIHR